MPATERAGFISRYVADKGFAGRLVNLTASLSAGLPVKIDNYAGWLAADRWNRNSTRWAFLPLMDHIFHIVKFNTEKISAKITDYLNRNITCTSSGVECAKFIDFLVKTRSPEVHPCHWLWNKYMPLPKWWWFPFAAGTGLPSVMALSILTSDCDCQIKQI